MSDSTSENPSEEQPRVTEPPPEPSTAALPRPPPPVWRRRVVIVLAVLLFATGFAATAATPVLATRWPAGLLLLDTNIRNLMLARRVPLASYLALGLSRRMLGATVMYLLGRWYGDGALRWFERHVGPSVRKGERFARLFGAPWILLWPGPIPCVTTGAVGLPGVQFLAAALVNSVALALLCRYAGDQFSSQLDAVVAFLRVHLAETTALAIAFSIASALRTYRQIQAKNAEAAAQAEGERPHESRSPTAKSATEIAASSEPQSK